MSRRETPALSPSCQGCRHYFVTHQGNMPRGCRAYGFKSAKEPAQVVLASSGPPCQLFRPRPSIPPPPGSDDRYI